MKITLKAHFCIRVTELYNQAGILATRIFAFVLFSETCFISPLVRESTTALDSGFQVLDSGLPRNPEQLGFSIPIHTGFRIP